MKEEINILIIEDNIIARETIMDVLSPLNCSFVEVDNGEEALEVIKQSAETLDAIILDLQLTGISGIETLKIPPSF